MTLDLDTVLVNEQTLSTRLSNLQTLLKKILDDVGVEYKDNNTINELIDLFVYVKQYYWQTNFISAEEDASKYSGKYYINVILPKLADVIKMNNVAYASWSNAGNGTFRGMFRLANNLRSANTPCAVFGCFKNDEKYTLLSCDWVMKIGFTVESFSGYPDVNLAGVGILISGSGDTVSSGSSNYYGVFAGVSQDSEGLHLASATLSNGIAPESVSSSNKLITPESKYYVELTNDSGNNRIIVKFYDDNDNLLHTEYIAHSAIYGSSTVVRTYKVFFGAFSCGWDNTSYPTFPDFVIYDGYVDVDV